LNAEGESQRRAGALEIPTIEVFLHSIFRNSYGAAQMERAKNSTDPDGLAEVWRSAEQRRAEDFGAWLSQVVAQLRRLKVSDAQATDPTRKPAAA
jgi:hypothetical protein